MVSSSDQLKAFSSQPQAQLKARPLTTCNPTNRGGGSCQLAAHALKALSWAALWHSLESRGARQSRAAVSPNGAQIVSHDRPRRNPPRNDLEPGTRKRRRVASPGGARRQGRVERIGFERRRLGALGHS